MHISFDLLHRARLQERKRRLLSLQGAMKNELGPLLRQGMEENLSFRDAVLSHLARRKYEKRTCGGSKSPPGLTVSSSKKEARRWGEGPCGAW